MRMNLSLYVRERIRWLYNKMVREKASPEYVARGWAIGMFWGCFAPLGTQLACSIPCAFLFRGSKIGATFGTLLTNQVTIFFIYPVQCWIGNRILGGNLTFRTVKEALKSLLQEKSIEALWDLKMEVFAAFFAGGLLFALILTPPTYFVVLSQVKRHRLRSGR